MSTHAGGAPSVLVCEGRAFDLPHSDVASLIASCALRIATADFRTAAPGSVLAAQVGVSGPYTTPVLVARTSSGEREMAVGVPAILGLLKRNDVLTDGHLFPQQRVNTAAALHAALHDACPAFDFLTFALDEHYNMRHANRSHGGLAALVTEALWSERRTVLASCAQGRHISSAAVACGVAAGALKLLEDILKLAHYDAASGRTSAFGDGAPAVFDCVAFGVGSAFLFSTFSAAAGDVRAWQAEVRAECPLLVAFVNALRERSFATQGFFSLKPIPPTAGTSAFDAERPFREGRKRFIAGLVAFSALYFLVVNAGTFVELIEALEEGEEGAEGEGDSAATPA